MLPEQLNELRQILVQTVQTIGLDPAVATSVTPALERPRQAGHGDLATNLAMQLARPLKRPPREVAQRVVDALAALPQAAALVERCEIAGPGFINFWLTPAARQRVVHEVLQRGEHFGRVPADGRAVMLEFVSANPTGPLHVGHGRQAALGDVLGNLLASQGWRVHREFYYNDAGAQIENLALSVQARGRGLSTDDERFPADGYRGEYIAEIARSFLARQTVQVDGQMPETASGDIEDLTAVRRFAVAYLRREQDLDLAAFGVHFDEYFLESSLYTDGKVEQTVAQLVAKGHTYEQDGALWLRSTDYGDDKDRVMRKSGGGYTYFVPDVAYHTTKWDRGYVQAINIQGSDHHGTVARVRAGLQALDIGIPEGYPAYVLHKMVRVMRGGQEVKISKRAGSYVTLRDLIEWSGGGDGVRGRDAVRYFLISRKGDTEFTFDVDLALSRSDENPVYYIQYAHARICSILSQAGASSVAADAPIHRLTAPSEYALMARMAAFPGVLAEAAAELSPHQLAYYLKDLAADFHTFYNAERVLSDDAELQAARMALLCAVRTVLQCGLVLIGISAPERL
ncbi:MAG: arginine--tRNA ligase [Lautropia sp.]|nr:arginine--tRNA ligase [Lautropia sp.]